MNETVEMEQRIDAVLRGRAAPFGPNSEPSGFIKQTVDGSVRVTRLGLEGDQQADRQHHGGTDKALLHYDHDHYAHWRRDQPHLSELLSAPGAFGENLSSSGLDEGNVCIGDRFQLGSAVVEVSQGRQPCWKLGHRFGDPRMVKAVVKTGRCGWYYRVVAPGEVAAGDPIHLLERPNPGWPVAEVFALLIAGRRDPERLADLNKLTELSTNWRARAAALLGRRG
ncbi:MAG TPA: MOSC domain-containing protein [Arenicellales bacterium]|nr:MOSC domain-containing protein [Arenicellales bacterium]